MGWKNMSLKDKSAYVNNKVNAILEDVISLYSDDIDVEDFAEDISDIDVDKEMAINSTSAKTRNLVLRHIKLKALQMLDIYDALDNDYEQEW